MFAQSSSILEEFVHSYFRKQKNNKIDEPQPPSDGTKKTYVMKLREALIEMI